MVKKEQSFIPSKVLPKSGAYANGPSTNPSEAFVQRHYLEAAVKYFRQNADKEGVTRDTKTNYHKIATRIRGDLKKGNDEIDIRKAVDYEKQGGITNLRMAARHYELAGKLAQEKRVLHEIDVLTFKKGRSYETKKEPSVTDLRTAEKHYQRAKRPKSVQRVRHKIFKIKRDRIRHGEPLEKRAAGIIGLTCLAFSLFFFSEGITGNVIGNSSQTPNLIGIVLFVIGLIGVYFNVKK